GTSGWRNWCKRTVPRAATIITTARSWRNWPSNAKAPFVIGPAVSAGKRAPLPRINSATLSTPSAISTGAVRRVQSRQYEETTHEQDPTHAVRQRFGGGGGRVCEGPVRQAGR